MKRLGLVLAGAAVLIGGWVTTGGPPADLLILTAGYGAGLMAMAFADDFFGGTLPDHDRDAVSGCCGADLFAPDDEEGNLRCRYCRRLVITTLDRLAPRMPQFPRTAPMRRPGHDHTVSAGIRRLGGA